MPASNELRLFLSSTFTDFLGERDYLAKKLFPALRSRCRERGIEFTEIDLRWGLTDEDAEQGLILGTCFERDRPVPSLFCWNAGGSLWLGPAHVRAGEKS